MSAWIITCLALLYIGLIFAVADWGERHANGPLMQRYQGLVYSLALAVYCTSWTYFGAVGTAVNLGWDYVPIYLGPLLLFTLGQGFLRKLTHVVKQQNVTSIAHFISARYGKRKHIALVAALTCLVVVVPYIALQLKAIASSYQVLIGITSGGPGDAWWQDSALLSATAIALFAVLFGTRKIHLTEPRRGLLLAVAFESLVKLVALVLLGIGAWILLRDQPFSIAQEFITHANARSAEHPFSVSEFLTKTVLGMAAVFLLPRQFHVAFVENASPSNLQTARYGFTGYLLIVTLVVIPIAVAGMHLFPQQWSEADSFVLLIPAHSGWDTLSALVFIGGFSAATGMIIIATLALSTMISNDVVMPRLLRSDALHDPAHGGHDYSLLILFVRRSMILLIMALSYLYYRVFARNYELAETGLLAFSLVIQLAPAVIGGLYWRRGHAYGVYAGLAAGLSLWFFTLMLPQMIKLHVLDDTLLREGLFGHPWLIPNHLFGLQMGPLTQGVLISLSANILAYILVSLRSVGNAQDQQQALAFVSPDAVAESTTLTEPQARLSNDDLLHLLGRFVGPLRAADCLQEYAIRYNRDFLPEDRPDPGLIRHAEHELAGVIGASSAAAMITAIIERRKLAPEEVANLFTGTTQAMQFSRKILHSTLEHLSQGVSVVDRELNLVAWNQRYLDMFNYPAGMIHVGRPIADIVRFNAERGLCGPGDIDAHVSKRISHMREGTPHVFQRIMPDGRVMEMRGNPIPGGGFVTSFTDITEYVHAVEGLAEAKRLLEQRVHDRTQTISEMNSELLSEVERRRETEQQLRQAKAEADAANASKSRFLALASHDILQPLNAARLFTASLATLEDAQRRQIVLTQLDKSLQATEELISTLLDIAKLDDGKLKPDIHPLSLQDLLSQLADEYGLIAERKGLRLHVRTRKADVMSDGTYLRRILQNLISNAIKYTREGGVLVGCRQREQHIIVQVWDTGPGIAEAELERIFEDFYRVDATARGEQGVGLGLGVVNRMARLLGHALTVHSRPGHGSVFCLRLPLYAGVIDTSATQVATPAVASAPSAPLPDLSIICVDDDTTNLAALQILLQQWNIEPVASFHAAEDIQAYAQNNAAPDVLIIDYQLGKNTDGFGLFQSLQEYWPTTRAILVSAAPETDLATRAKQAGMLFLAKPIKPGALRAALNFLRSAKRAGG